jgi:hypothetical protein
MSYDRVDKPTAFPITALKKCRKIKTEMVQPSESLMVFGKQALV